MIQSIMEDLIGAVSGAQGAIFLDDEGESISQVGETTLDMKLLGAWKEIHFDNIKEITGRLGLGNVNAVLFSLEEGNALIAPVAGSYSLLLFLSSFSDVRVALDKLKNTSVLLQKDIE